MQGKNNAIALYFSIKRDDAVSATSTSPQPIHCSQAGLIPRRNLSTDSVQIGA
jgi:hypothetical protein